tara:strand:- start:6683 stop:6862 length:180 start_codon:yes stop_codon:yes gene_type:complete
MSINSKAKKNEYDPKIKPYIRRKVDKFNGSGEVKTVYSFDRVNEKKKKAKQEREKKEKE